MRCAFHLTRNAVGYCSVCGGFGCEECLVRHIDGLFYCHKHYRPIAEAMEDEKRRKEIRHKPNRQRLVAHLVSGETVQGYCFRLNLEEKDFRIDLADNHGELTGGAKVISFGELKALYYVKSFDGHFDKAQEFPELKPEGSAVVVRFKDGELLRGYTLQPYRKTEARFHVIPEKKDANEISILVESSAVEGVYAPEAYARKLEEEMQAFLREHAGHGLSRDELVGDYFFQQHGYQHALRYYQTALETHPLEPRLLRKAASTEYNLGILHIRNHKYDNAIRCMEAVLHFDPSNEKAAKKLRQLRERL